MKYQSEGQAEIVKRFAHGLLSDVVQHFDEKIEKCENSLISDKMSLVVTRDDLKVILALMFLLQWPDLKLCKALCLGYKFY